MGSDSGVFSCHIFSSSILICFKYPPKPVEEGIKINLSTVNKLCSKYTAVFIPSFPVARAAESHLGY